MAEGGQDFENPAYEDDFDPDEEIELPDAPDESIIGDEPLDTKELREKLTRSELRDKKIKLVNSYYNSMKEKYGLESNNKDFNNFEILGNRLYFLYDDKFGNKKSTYLVRKE